MFFQNLVHAQRFKYPIATYPVTLAAGESASIVINADTTESVGSNLVTDSGFDAVTEGSNLLSGDDSDFDTVGNWVAGGAATVTGGYDSGDVGHDKCLRAEAGDDSNEVVRIAVGDLTTLPVHGNCYKLKFDYKFISKSGDGAVGFSSADNIVALTADAGAWQEDVVVYINAGATLNYLQFYFNASGSADDEFLLDNAELIPITFTNWTTTHWAPQAVGGVLTGKAVKVAGTADDLEQDISAVATTIYRNQYVATRSAGTLTPQVGGVDGTAITSSDTYSDDITATGTGNLKFQADASFAGTVDLFTARAVTNPKQNGITVELHRDSERLVTYKTVAGTTTVRDDSAITYSATAKVIALHDSDNLLSVFYDSALVYSGTVSDASIINNKRHYVATGEGSGAFSVERLTLDSTEKLTNSSFTTDVTGWSSARSATLSWQAGSLRTTNAGGVASGGAVQEISGLTAGKVYKATWTVLALSGLDRAFYRISNDAALSSIFYNHNSLIGVGSWTAYFVAPASTLYFACQNYSGANGNYAEWSEVSVKQVNP